MGYRASRQATAKYSPYFMLFQKEMRLPIDTEVIPQENEEVDVEELMEKLLEARQQAFAEVDANIKSAQTKQKETYDRKHQPSIFTTGTEVLLENTKQKQRKGGKLESLWLGPYTVHQHIGKGVYKLKTMDGEILKKKANINRLKVYTRREESADKQSSVNSADRQSSSMIKGTVEEKSDDVERERCKAEEETHEEVERLGLKRKCSARSLSVKHRKCDEVAMIDDSNAKDLEEPWVIVDSMRLYSKEKAILMNGEWLSDTLIHAAQLLMKNEKDLINFEGFQNPIYVSKFSQMDGQVAQILHSGGNHWITISSVGSSPNTVRVYDSLLSCQLPLSTKKVIASLMHCNEKVITLEYADIQVS